MSERAFRGVEPIPPHMRKLEEEALAAEVTRIYVEIELPPLRVEDWPVPKGVPDERSS